MANILRDELIENNYVSTNNIDNELPPTHVVLYLKNISGINKKTVIEPIPLQQVLLTNQNPSLKLTYNEAVFCLSPPSLLECIPIVNEVSCLCLDTTENYKVTVDNETFSGSYEDVVSFLASHGLYAYPSKTKCNPSLSISCDGAVSSFAAKTSFETNAIEIQIDDGLWTDIYTPNPFVSIRFQPGNPGADLVVELTDNNSHTVRLRTTRDIGLYVNPLTGFDQINNNKAYKIYSRNGDLIDPYNTELYDYTGREFDDTSTNEDYAIFFAQAEFCLAPSDICVALPPLDLNLAKTFYPFDTSKQYHLYYQDSEGNFAYSEIYGNQLNNTLGYITARGLRLDGFEFFAESEVGFDPDYCNEWGYTGDFYVTQNKATWLDSDYIGYFYIEMDGNRQYLDNSSKNFPHAGSSANLKSALAPYYESVAAFLREVGIDAVYKPNIGSYNSGGITINMTEEQYSTISFGSQSGYDLKFDGYAQVNCINSKTLSELPNPPSTLRIIALDGGEARKSSYTLLGSHPPIDLNSINILTLFGITDNYEISSCFINISDE